MRIVDEHDVVVVARGHILDVDVDAAHGLGHCKERTVSDLFDGGMGTMIK